MSPTLDQSQPQNPLMVVTATPKNQLKRELFKICYLSKWITMLTRTTWQTSTATAQGFILLKYLHSFETTEEPKY
uniref:Putative ovule protein n=1 Tax=Solanum chacoense TaxID=4108 RepID=A0A0V0H869_SOLCH